MDARRDTDALHFTYDPDPEVTHSPPHIPTIFSLPLRPRIPRPFDTSDLKPIAVDPSNFYYSTAIHNPLFDAFFFHCYPEGGGALPWKLIELYVLRTITSDRLDDSRDAGSGGFRAVAALRDKVQQKHPNAMVKIFYVLVAPMNGSYARDVQWDLALAFDDVPGEVHVQYLECARRWYAFACFSMLLLGSGYTAGVSAHRTQRFPGGMAIGTC